MLSNTIQLEIQKIPKLRFPGFSGGWEEKRLDGVFSMLNGYAFTGSDAQKDGCSWVKIADVGINEMKHDSLSFLPYEYGDKYHNFLLQKGDFVVALTRPTLGGKLKIAKIDEIFSGSLLNQRVGKIISSNDLNYIYCMLQQRNLISKIENRIAGTDPPNLSPNEIGSLKIFIPSLPEQQKIADFLGVTDKWIENLRKQKESFESYKKRIMQKIFNQEIRFKDEKGNDFPEWEEKKLGEICKITTGKLDANAMKKNGAYRFYTCAKVYFMIDKYAFDTEALLISGNGANVGYIHYYKGKFNAYQRTYVLDDFKSDITFTKYFLDTKLSTRILKEKKAGNTPYIVLATLEDMIISLPPVPEQQKIAEFLTSIDKQIESKQHQIANAEQWKKGLMQELFV